MLRSIIQHPNPVLDNISAKVEDVQNTQVQRLVGDLIDTLKSTRDGIGLAAPQIGENLRVFVGEINKQIRVFINPEITNLSNKTTLLDEGCLSVPAVVGRVPRARKLTVKAFDETGKKFKLTLKGIEAQLIQHEVDHLDGMLFLRRAAEVHRLK